MTIDWDFLGKREGAEILVGYVPQNRKTGEVIGNSGVTIATGFDIGQWSKDQIRSFGLSPALTRKLLPYCTTYKEDAKALLRAQPLTVTLIEAKAIDKAAKAYFTDKLRREYDADSKVPFDRIPDEAQTVMMSAEFQYGTISLKLRGYWRLLTEQKWKEAEQALRDMKAYHPRRVEEANYLHKAVKRLEEQERKAKEAKQAQSSSLD